VALAGCSDDAETGAKPDTSAKQDTAAADVPLLDGGLVATVQSCQPIVIAQQAVRPGPWRVVGRPTLAPDLDPSSSALTLRAPAVARSTDLILRSDNGNAQYTVRVEPTASAADLAIGLAPDCPPFGSGVASGEPGPDNVLLWTHLDVAAVAAATAADPRQVTWQLAAAPDFAVLLQSGTAQAAASRGDTVHVTVQNLTAGSTLYYRFVAADGSVSAVGRTRTAPAAGNQRARFALLSCSSLWSGYFGAYANLASRNDLDLIVHVGDYVYDSVDPDEQVRIPTPPPPEPQTLAEHRDRHLFYLRDPDLRAARGAHAWLVLWDNHDLIAGSPPAYGGGVQAFREFVPMRQPDPQAADIAYRVMPWGDLIDFVLMDVLIWRGRDTLPGTQAQSLLGNAQYNWLATTLQSSKARWRMVATQKLVSPFEAPFDGGGRTFSGYPEARQQLLDLLLQPAIGSTVVLSGDAHLTIAADLLADPGDPSLPDNPYQPGTGKGAVAPEFMGASITRGNVDETLGEAPPEFYQELTNTFLVTNPHFAFTNLVDHGYGLLDVTPERTIAELHTVPILQWSQQGKFAGGVQANHGDRHWQRGVRTEPTLP
jgi:alkaline phosphatase D